MVYLRVPTAGILYYTSTCMLQKAPGWSLDALRALDQPGALPNLIRFTLQTAPPAQSVLWPENHSGRGESVLSA
jgi:hypothetical protein